jgi:hypothetical protein
VQKPRSARRGEGRVRPSGAEDARPARPNSP